MRCQFWPLLSYWTRVQRCTHSYSESGTADAVEVEAAAISLSRSLEEVGVEESERVMCSE